MNADEFPEEIEAAKRTQLDRLGSQQSLVALTDADLAAEQVLRAAALSERAARETFGEWADTDDNEAAAEVFGALAELEADHHERVVAELDDESVENAAKAAELDPMHEHLRELDETVERAAGLVGRALVADRTQLQVVNFFVNEADERRADLFRELRADTQQGVAEGVELLASHCESDDDWERARATAEAVVQVAYDDYAETLDGMGLDPKPIC
ncbi:rubrerythrin family protein [Halorussus litoreus]|uniref:rubrerythrin family protein n=1 Tax=Halorussus litoreus TaxID=1710536 RepID=UPI000E287315|nr:rubrerythrin family protein [Halorussus litoreus]